MKNQPDPQRIARALRRYADEAELGLFEAWGISVDYFQQLSDDGKAYKTRPGPHVCIELTRRLQDE